MSLQIVDAGLHPGTIRPLRAIVNHRPGIGLVALMAVVPWLSILAVCSGGPRTAIVALSVGVALFGLGELLTVALVPKSARIPELHLICLPVGFILAAALLQTSANVGLPVQHTALFLCLLGLGGLPIAYRKWKTSIDADMQFGWIYVILTILVGLVYLLPAARNNATYTADHGFQWTYVDTAYHQAITAEIANGIHPLRNPGFVESPLKYHVGRHAIAAAIANLFGTTIADSLVRITMALSLFSVTLAVVALARVAAARVSQKGLAGAASIVIFFFLPGLQTLFLNETDSSAWSPQILSWRQGLLEPGPRMTNWDRYLAHLHLDGSCTSGLLVLLTVAVLLGADTAAAASRKLPASAMLVACLGVCLNGVAAAAALAVVAGVVFIEGWRNLRTYVILAASGAVFVGVMAAAGFFTASSGNTRWDTLHEKLSHLPQYLVRLSWVSLATITFVASPKVLSLFLLGQGGDRIRKIFLLFILSLVGMFVLFVLEGYPLLLLGPLLSVFAGAGFAGLWDTIQLRREETATVSRVPSTSVRRYSSIWLLCVLSGAALMAFLSPIEQVSGSPLLSQRLRIYAAILAALIAVAMWALIRTNATRWPRFARFVRRSAWAILIAGGLLGSMRYYFNYGCDGLVLALTLDPARVQSLEAVKGVVPVGSLLATTHHSVPVPFMMERSYMYSAIGERQVLLEGWRYGEHSEELLEKVQRDNETLFSTQNPAEARQVVRRYGIGYLVVEPGEKLGIDAAKVPWLRQIPIPGSLTLYAVVDSIPDRDSRP